MVANNSSSGNDTRCGGLNPSFHHCFSSEINSFEQALTSILVVEFLIVIFGVVGNMCLFFLMRRDRFSPQAFSVYFMFSAVSDSCNLIINLASDVAGSVNKNDFSSQAAKLNNCGILYMVSSTPGLISPWLIVLLTLDRFVSTWFPQSHSKIVNRRRGIALASSIVLIAFVVNIGFATSYKPHMDFNSDLNKTSYSCELTLFSEPLVGELVSMVISNIIPLCLILILSASICYGLRKSNKFRSHRCCQWNRTNVLVFYVAVMIFLAWCPGNVVEIVETSYAIRNIDSPILKLIVDKTWHACLMLYLFSFAQNFYIFMLMSPIYRLEFRKMMMCKKDDDSIEEDIEFYMDDDMKPMLAENDSRKETKSITL